MKYYQIYFLAFFGCVLWPGKNLILVSAQNDLQWQRIIPSTSVQPPARRDGAIGFDQRRNQIVLFGGRSSKILDDTWLFNITSQSWSSVPPTLVSGKQVPAARFTIVSGTNNDKFFISTGEGTGKTFFNDVVEFDFSTMKWKTRTPSNAGDAPKVRYGASGGIHPDGDALYVTHGFAGTRYSDTFKYDLKNNKWILLHKDINQYDPFGPHPRCLQSGTMISVSKMILFGGCLSGGKTGGPCPSQDSWVFDSSEKKWDRLETCASPRIYSSMAMLPTALSAGKNISIAILFGGTEKNNAVLQVTEARKGEVIIFDPASKEKGDQWKRKSVFSDALHGCPSLRSGHMMVTTKDGVMMFGGNNNSGGGFLNDIWLLKGTSVSALNSKTSGECQHSFFNLIALHGIFMFLGWGVMLQLGAFIARYFRRKDPLWFKLHRIFQILGLLLAIGGLVCGILSVRFDHLMFPHAIIGIVVMAAGIFQPINAIFRPHKPEPGLKASTKRTIWEWLHKLTGRLALILALVNVTLGLFLGLASVALWAIWLAYVAVIIISYIFAEIILIRSKTKTGSTDFQMNIK